MLSFTIPYLFNVKMYNLYQFGKLIIYIVKCKKTVTKLSPRVRRGSYPIRRGSYPIRPGSYPSERLKDRPRPIN